MPDTKETRVEPQRHCPLPCAGRYVVACTPECAWWCAGSDACAVVTVARAVRCVADFAGAVEAIRVARPGRREAPAAPVSSTTAAASPEGAGDKPGDSTLRAPADPCRWADAHVTLAGRPRCSNPTVADEFCGWKDVRSCPRVGARLAGA